MESRRLLVASRARDGTLSRNGIMVAAAQLVAPTLRAVVTYDRRMADAAASLGFAVAAPG